MDNVIKLIAEALANRNKLIEFKHNSVYSALEINPSSSNLSDVSVMIAGMVKNEIGKIRNLMIPVAKTFISKTEKVLSDSPLPNSLLEYKITERKIPEILQYLKDNGLLPNVARQIELPSAVLVIPEPKGVIKDAIQFNNEVLNIMLKTILVQYTDEMLLNIWAKYLGNISSTNDNINRITLGDYNTLDDLIVLFAMVQKIKIDRPDGVSAPEGTYITVMDLLYSKISNALLSVIENFKSSTDLNKLVIKARPKELIVNGDLLDTFLVNNTMDVLLGLLLSGDAKDYMDMSDISGGAEKYTGIWDHANKLEQLKRASQEVSRYKAAYDMVLTDIINNIPEELHDDLTCLPRNSIEMLRLVIDRRAGDEVLNISKMSMEIVGKIVFGNSNFGRFTTYMMRYSELNTKLTPEEAATMATIDMVLDYLTDQFTVLEA